MKTKTMKLLVLTFISFLTIGCEEERKSKMAENIFNGVLNYLNVQSDERYEKCGRGDVCEGKNGENLVCKECIPVCEAEIIDGKWTIKPDNFTARRECRDRSNPNGLMEWLDESGSFLDGDFAEGERKYAMLLKSYHKFAKEIRTKNTGGTGKDPEKIVVRKDSFDIDVLIELSAKIDLLVKLINYEESGYYRDSPKYDICQYEDGHECGGSKFVNLKDFTALNKLNSIYLTWTTTLEKDNAGFYIWRGEKEDGKYIKITDNLIPSKGNDSQYAFIDKNVNGDNTYYYKLEDIDFCGKSTFLYPISSSSSKVLLIKPTTNIIVSSEQIPLEFEWEKDNYSKFKFQFSDNNGQTLYEIPSEWIKGTSMTPPSTIWKNFTQERKEQTLLWRVVGENEQGQSFFNEIRHLTIK